MYHEIVGRPLPPTLRRRTPAPLAGLRQSGRGAFGAEPDHLYMVIDLHPPAPPHLPLPTASAFTGGIRGRPSTACPLEGSRPRPCERHTGSGIYNLTHIPTTLVTYDSPGESLHGVWFITRRVARKSHSPSKHQTRIPLYKGMIREHLLRNPASGTLFFFWGGEV